MDATETTATAICTVVVVVVNEAGCALASGGAPSACARATARGAYERKRKRAGQTSLARPRAPRLARRFYPFARNATQRDAAQVGRRADSDKARRLLASAAAAAAAAEAAQSESESAKRKACGREREKRITTPDDGSALSVFCVATV